MGSQGPWVRRRCCRNWEKLMSLLLLRLLLLLRPLLLLRLLLMLLHRKRGQQHRSPVLLRLEGSALLQQLAELLNADGMVAVELLRKCLVLLLQPLEGGCLVGFQR